MCNFDSSLEMGQSRESDKTARIVEVSDKRLLQSITIKLPGKWSGKEQ
jgi:hypothetical protein